MNLEFIFGGSGAGKTYKLYNEIINSSMKNHSENYFLIVPEQFTMETQRDIIKMHPNNGSMNIDIVSFNRLAYRVFGELGVSRLSVLDDTGKMLILRKVIEDNKDRLSIFKNKVKMFGFVEEIKSTISELYQYGINVEDIDGIIEKIKGSNIMKSKLSDIGIIYDSFKKYVENISTKEIKYITKEEVLDELCDVIDQSSIIKNSVIALDGFTGFTPIQCKLLGHLIKNAKKVVVTLTVPEEEAEKIGEAGFENIKEHELFNMSKTTVNTLIKIAESVGNNSWGTTILYRAENVYRLRNNNSVGFLERNIFRSNGKKLKESDKNILVYAYDNLLEESGHIANMIFNMVRESDGALRYRDIAVITGDLESYRRPLEEALSHNKIPYFIDNKSSLLGNNFVECLRALLEMLDENFSYESVFRYLRRGMSDIAKDDIDLFENYVLGCGIRGFSSYNKPFRKKYRNLSDEEFNRCEGIRVEFINVFEEIHNKVKNATVKEITVALYEFIKENRFYDKLNEYINSFDDNENTKQEYAQSYRLVMELLDKLVSLLGDEKITLKEYRKILDDGFEEIKVGTIPLLIDQLVIGDIERTRLNNVKILIVAGVNDGVIPRSAGKSGLLSQKDRNVLKNISVTISPTARENSFIQKFYLYLNLTKPSEKLILTYSNAGLNGNAKRPSYLINTITKMIEDIEINNITEYSEDMLENVITRDSAFDIVSKGLRNCEYEPVSDLWKELFSFYSGRDEYKKRLKRALDGAFYVSRTGKIDDAIAKVLYGENIGGRITGVEKYANCAYMHFLMYGLKLVERQVYEIKANDVGNIYHKAIEIFSQKVKSEKLDFKTIGDAERSKMVDESVKDAIVFYGYDAIDDSAQNKYILDKVKKITEKSAWAICEHIKRGGFNPELFELSLARGRIDRVDILESGDCLYVKVIDYKSGNTKFNSEEVVNGLQLQLVYYMDAVLDITKKNHSDKKVIPGGLFYFRIHDPIIDYDEKMIDDEYMERAMLKQYQMTGVFNSTSEVVLNIDSKIGDDKKSNSVVFNGRYNEIDKEDMVKANGMGLSSYNFEKLIEYVKEKSAHMVEEIKSGNIEANPYKKDQNTSCAYCKYNSICNFNKKEFNDSYRRLKKIEKRQ